MQCPSVDNPKVCNTKAIRLEKNVNLMNDTFDWTMGNIIIIIIIIIMIIIY